MQTTDPTGIFNRNKLSEEFSNVLPDEARLKLDAILLEIQTDFPEICYSLEYLNTKFRSRTYHRRSSEMGVYCCKTIIFSIQFSLKTGRNTQRTF